MNRVFVRCLVCSLALVLAGCATLFAPEEESITITSVPEGADVYWRGTHLGKTPLVTDIRRVPETTWVVLEKEGYESRKVTLGRQIEGVSFFNLGFITTTLGAPSWGLDILTGRMFKYAPTKYATKLEKSGGSSAWNGQVFEYVMINDQAIKRDLARRDGPEIENLCKLLKKSTARCTEFRARISRQRELLLASVDALDLYSGLSFTDEN